MGTHAQGDASSVEREDDLPHDAVRLLNYSLGNARQNLHLPVDGLQGLAQETECIPLTEYCRVFLGQRRGAKRLESIRRVVAATVG
jgi:hypothetical protein